MTPPRLGSPMPSHRFPYGCKPGEVTILRRVATFAGEPVPEHAWDLCYPESCCPVIGSFLAGWEPYLPDADRQALVHPLAPALVNSRGNAAVRARRAGIAAEWLASTWHGDLLRADRVTSSPDPNGGSLPLLGGMRQDVIRACGYAHGAAPRQPWLRSWDAGGDAEMHRIAAWLAQGAAAWRNAWSAAAVVAETRPLGTLADLEHGITTMLNRMIEVRPREPYRAHPVRRNRRPIPLGWFVCPSCEPPHPSPSKPAGDVR